MIHSHKHLNPGEACATCLIDERENGMDNSKKWLIGAGALVVVGGALGYYLHNKKKKEEVTDSSSQKAVVKPQIEYTAKIEDEKLGLAAAEAFASIFQTLGLLGILGKGGKAFNFGQTKIYQYTSEGVVADLASQDGLGSFDSLYFSPTQVAVTPMVRLGLATDVLDKPAGTVLSGLITKPALAMDRDGNRKLIAECYNLPQNTSFYLSLSNSGYLDTVIKLLMRVCSRANFYWIERGKSGKAQDPSLLNIHQGLNPLEAQRVCAATLWAIVQGELDMQICLGNIMDRMGISAQDKGYLFLPVGKTSGLRTGSGWVRCLNYINAFSDGLFNCENPGTNLLKVASSSLEKAAQLDSPETSMAKGELKNAVIVGGVVFYQE